MTVSPGGAPELTRRERQIALSYIEGEGCKTIARTLGISPATVRTHVNAIYRKLEVTNRIELLHRLAPAVAGGAGPAQAQASEPDMMSSRPPPWQPGDLRQEKSAIAVLAFEDLGSTEQKPHLGAGIAEDILIELGRFRSLFVIARNSSFTYRGRAVPLRRIGVELGARYVLSGSVRASGSGLRIATSLADAVDGHQVWGERYDGPAEDIFRVRDDVVSTIAATLVGRVEAAAASEARRQPTESLAAYDLVLRAKELRHRHTPADELAAQRLLDQAVALDPAYAQARAQLALTHLQQFFWDDTDGSPHRAAEIALAALDLDPREPWSHMVLGLAYVHLRRWDEALRHSLEAVALNPSDPALCAKHGLLLADLGRPAEGIASIERAMRLDPFEARSYCSSLGLALFAARRYPEAIRAIDAAPGPTFYHHVWRAAAHAHLGLLEQARFHAAECMRLAPDFRISRFARLEPIRDPADLEHWLAGFRRAGVPE
jgi:adenylate cyclase